MPAEYTYFRKYIILKNDYTNIANLNPKGHGKIEVRGSKGVISLNVENCELEKDYKVYLLKDKNGEVYEYDLGRIITDEKGRSRTNITLNLRDLESKGFPIDEIDAILIRKGIYVLLGGYIDKDNGAIDRFIKRFILEKKEEPFESFKKIEKKVEKLPETESIEKPEEIIEEIEEPRVVIKEVEEPKIIIEEAEKIQENIEETEIMDEEKVKVDMETIEYNKEEVLENISSFFLAA